MSIPTKITPCPIVDTIVEIRFSTSLPPDAVFGILYNSLKDDFSKVEKFPILGIPEEIRMKDPNLRFKPHYKIYNEKLIIQIGPDIISFGQHLPYQGWEEFSKGIYDVLFKIMNTNIISKIERLGFRYVNFFPNKSIEDLNINLAVNNININSGNTVLRTDFIKEDLISVLQVNNNARINNGNDVGLVIDIDISTTANLDNFFVNKQNIIEKCHDFEKEIFFSLLKTLFLQQLNPIY